MEEIINFLNDSNPTNVKLYFVEKDSKDKKINYKALKTKIDVEIGKEIILSAIGQINLLLKGSPEYIDYDVLPYSDRSHIETINKDNVPFLDDLLIQIAGTTLDEFKIDESSQIQGYVIEIENGSEMLVLFRKYNPKKLLEKNKLSMKVHEGRLEKIEGQVIAIEDKFDAALLLKENFESSKVLIFNRTFFEYFFSFSDFYEAEIIEKKSDLEVKGLLDDNDGLINLCKSDARKLKKLARILKSNELDKLKGGMIPEIVSNFKLTDIELDGSGKIIVNKKNVWTVLKILDDDYLTSESTSVRYESHSKVKK